MVGRDVTVRVEGVREFRRALKRVSPELDKTLRVEIRGIGASVAAEAQSRAVRQTGTYARSIRVYTSGVKVSVGSRLPQAGVLHWGGTIRPRGVPIVFPRRPVVYEAVERQNDKIVDRVGDAVERAARNAGWNT